MAFSSFDDWSFADLAKQPSPQQTQDTIDYAKLAAYLESNPAGSLTSLNSIYGFDNTNPIIVPPIADDGISSPESSAAASSSSENRQDSAPAEVDEKPAKGANKRKTGTTPATSLKDSRRGAKKDAVHHTHEEDDNSSAGKRKGAATTSEKRKEQNRNAQRAFRERRDRHTKELEDKVAELQAIAQEKDTENKNLKEIVTRLRSENERLTGSAFTFNVPSGLVPASASAASPVAFSANDPLLSTFASFAAKPDPVPAYSSGPSSQASVSEAGTPDLFKPLITPDVFGDYHSIFTPSGDSISPLDGFEDILAASSPSTAPGLESALSPRSTEALFSAYRDPLPLSASVPPSGLPRAPASASVEPSRSKTESPSDNVDLSSWLGDKSDESKPGMPLRSDNANCSVFIESLSNLRGAEGYDLDSLCKDMLTKATCKQAAAVALEKAVTDDLDIHTFFSDIISEPHIKATYAR